ncbi:MAG: shikimate dehydrogenase [Bacteroidales bacterium]|nr:shikimate dehydrogenase [Bacteroidales bacterium]
MRIYGLIGYPLEHSYSETWFNKQFQANGTDARYLNIPIEDIGQIHLIVSGDPRLAGLNITIPHKVSVIPHLDNLTRQARRIGAVNAVRVIRDPGGIRLIGHNTDWEGFYRSVRDMITPIHRKALILGTGGSARAVAYALDMLGIGYLFVSRNPRSRNQISYQQISPSLIKDHLLIVNATPVGMYPRASLRPPIPYRHLVEKHILFDLVYNPEETLFLKSGKEKGATVRNGYGMLTLQAGLSWDFWNSHGQG